MAWLLILVACGAFAGVSWLAWIGQLGFKAIGLLIVATAAWFKGRKGLEPSVRGRLNLPAKIAFTIVGCMALLRHPIEIEEGRAAPVYTAIVEYVDQVDSTTFFTFALIAMAVKFSGVIASAFGWHLLLIGQGIRFPFWSKIMTSFLIGRFIGTFLPSTIGLDGYTLYEAGRYSNQWSRAATAKALEKFIGVTGLFLGMVLTMPFGFQVIRDVTEQAGRPESAPALAAAILAFAGGVSAVVVAGLVRPGVLIFGVRVLQKLTSFGLPASIAGKVTGPLERLQTAVGAYHGKVGLLMMALVAKFITHFTTSVVYYFTALAIGVVGAAFWPIVFGSSIQILATLFSPTIAGEGAREAFQALLLQQQLGGVAQAVLSGALGFIAAEAATLWGGLFLLTRKPGWRPAFTLVDDQQVDYAWIDDADGGFDADKIRDMQAQASA